MCACTRLGRFHQCETCETPEWKAPRCSKPSVGHLVLRFSEVLTMWLARSASGFPPSAEEHLSKAKGTCGQDRFLMLFLDMLGGFYPLVPCILNWYHHWRILFLPIYHAGQAHLHRYCRHAPNAPLELVAAPCVWQKLFPKTNRKTSLLPSVACPAHLAKHYLILERLNGCKRTTCFPTTS